VRKIGTWFMPLFKAVELLTPAAGMAIQAYPNPGSLVLGGIIGILQLTNRLMFYQKSTLRMLVKMGRKAHILLEYERDVYKDDSAVQKAIIIVHGDILAFCQKAFRFLTKNGELRARVKGLSLIMFKDYESQLGKEVEDFENDMENLKERLSISDRKRLMELRDSQKDQDKKLGQGFAESHEYLKRQEDRFEKLYKREQDLREG
jgi:hypothetical protein